MSDSIDNLHFWRMFHSFLRHDHSEEEILRTRDNGKWIADNFAQLRRVLGDNERMLIDLVWRHHEKNGGAPLAGMVEEILQQEEKNGGLLADWDSYNELRPNLKAYDAIDLNQLLTEQTDKYHAQQFQHALGKAALILDAGWEDRQTKRKLRGRQDASEYLQKFLSSTASVRTGLAGMLDFHTEEVVRHLQSGFQDGVDERRCLTLLPSIDQNVVIGLDGLKFVGIAGQSSHGKSLLLNTLCYNLLRQGKNVLYNSLEHDPLDIWTKVAFLHADYFDQDFRLPPLQDFLLGKQAKRPPTAHDWQNVEILRRDIEERGGLSGRLDVQSLRTWDELIVYADTHHVENNYSVIIVDYLEHLDVVGDTRFQDAAFKQLIKLAHAYTKTFAKGRGIVLITPLPINKESAKEAEFNQNNPAKPFSLTAIRGASQFTYSLDLILGIHSDDSLKAENKMVVFGLKSRAGNHDWLAVCNVRPMNKLLTEPERSDPAETERVLLGVLKAEYGDVITEACDFDS